jgi:hypothetical protein
MSTVRPRPSTLGLSQTIARSVLPIDADACCLCPCLLQQPATMTTEKAAPVDEFVQPQSGFGQLVIGTQIVLLVLFGLLVDQHWSQVCPNGIAEICGAPTAEHTCTSSTDTDDCTFTSAADCPSACTYTAATAHSPLQYAIAEERYYKIYLDIALMMLVRMRHTEC